MVGKARVGLKGDSHESLVKTKFFLTVWAVQNVDFDYTLLGPPFFFSFQIAVNC